MGRLLEVCQEFLIASDWDFEVLGAGDTQRIRFSFAGEQARLDCWLITYEETQRLCFLSSYRAVVPEDKRVATAEYVTRANFGILVGNFELDFSDGEVRFKTSADVEGIEITSVFVQNLLVANLLTADKYFPGLMKVLYAGMTPADALAVVRESH